MSITLSDTDELPEDAEPWQYNIDDAKTLEKWIARAKKTEYTRHDRVSALMEQLGLPNNALGKKKFNFYRQQGRSVCKQYNAFYRTEDELLEVYVVFSSNAKLPLKHTRWFVQSHLRYMKLPDDFILKNPQFTPYLKSLRKSSKSKSPPVQPPAKLKSEPQSRSNSISSETREQNENGSSSSSKGTPDYWSVVMPAEK